MTDPSISQQQARERRDRLKRLGVDQAAQDQARLAQQERQRINDMLQNYNFWKTFQLRQALLRD